jgi:REP element-mobilizing transposase RayT
MAKTIGYMITWTTYGSWLQGDKRGFVKNGRIRPANKALEDCITEHLKKQPVRLSPKDRTVVQKAILEKAHQLNHKICALCVASNHVHIVAEYIPVPIGGVVKLYKNAAIAALRAIGFSGRIWTKGFDKRYCFDERSLTQRARYVNSHNMGRKHI